MADPTQRFSSRVEDYARYRPSYPVQVLELLERECGLSAASVVADVGSGTGILSALLLERGWTVYCVEPNAAMRIEAERSLAHNAHFHSIDGRSESTGVSHGSADLVTAAQAFHWFDRAAARAEFHRILKPEGWVALIWNERLVSGRFLEGYEALLHRYGTDYAKVDHRNVDERAIEDFFGHSRTKRFVFPNEQRFDLAGLMGRVRSSSYVPIPGTPPFDALAAELETLFAECAGPDGRVAFLYETIVYLGQFGPA